MKRIGQSRIRRWSTDRLIRRALSLGSGNHGWEAVAHLHQRGSPVTQASIVRLFRSSSAHRRSLALGIAAQLRAGRGGDPFDPAATQAMLVAGLHDRNPGVAQSAIFGLGHRPLPSALPALLVHARHPAAIVRFALAFTLGHYSEAHAIAALIRLATDSDDDVRDWATFSLGTLHEADDDSIRSLLWKNAHDPNRDVRGEAVVGLARRSDARVIALLQERLADDDCRVYELEAAEEMPRAELLQVLQRVRADAQGRPGLDLYWYRHLLDAIDACELVADAAA